VKGTVSTMRFFKAFLIHVPRAWLSSTLPELMSCAISSVEIGETKIPFSPLLVGFSPTVSLYMGNRPSPFLLNSFTDSA
jgi:hypothetical protein